MVLDYNIILIMFTSIGFKEKLNLRLADLFLQINCNVLTSRSHIIQLQLRIANELLEKNLANFGKTLEIFMAKE